MIVDHAGHRHQKHTRDKEQEQDGEPSVNTCFNISAQRIIAEKKHCVEWQNRGEGEQT